MQSILKQPRFVFLGHCMDCFSFQKNAEGQTPELHAQVPEESWRAGEHVATSSRIEKPI